MAYLPGQVIKFIKNYGISGSYYRIYFSFLDCFTDCLFLAERKGFKFMRLIDTHPLILGLIFFAFIGLFIWWLSQPVKIIYDPDAPPIWIDDDPEGGYFPRR